MTLLFSSTDTGDTAWAGCEMTLLLSSTDTGGVPWILLYSSHAGTPLSSDGRCCMSWLRIRRLRTGCAALSSDMWGKGL